jgi:hypothetical protein
MNPSPKPWRARESDFSSPDWYAQPTVGYQLMFEFLRLSPSYEMARKAAAEGLSSADKLSLPSDFESVQQMYERCGDVQRTLFREWWLDRGLRLFGNPHNKPTVQEVGWLEQGELEVSSSVEATLNHYLSGVREEEGLPGSVLVAIPTSLRASDIRTQVQKILERAAKESRPKRTRPVLTLEGQRLRKSNLLKGLRLLWVRAARPSWEYWRLGTQVQYSAAYAAQLAVDAPRKAEKLGEAYDREMMTKIVSRALNKYELIAENAARGRFPSEASVEKMDFDYLRLAKRIRQKNRWEERRKSQYYGG